MGKNKFINKIVFAYGFPVPGSGYRPEPGTLNL